MRPDKMEMTIEKRIPQFLLEEKTIFSVLLGISLVVGMQKLIGGPDSYNNYIIFKTSFFHLYHNQDLYKAYPQEYYDIFLYSPTFAALMAPFVWLPVWLQVLVWCCLNALCVFAAINLLPLGKRERVLLFWLMLLEYITAMQSLQTAPMVASFIILAFVSFERKKIFWAAFFIVLAASIKIYAIGAAVLFLMYPKRLKFIAYFLFWNIIFFAAPLLFVSYNQLIFLYKSWYSLTMSVHQGEQTGVQPNTILPLSVMSWLKVWFKLTPPALYVQLAGTALLCLPFIRYKSFQHLNFRLFMLASLLIWAMIFNHIAESASYIVAILGVCIWFVTEEKNKYTIALMAGVFVLSIYSPSSLFPTFIREQYIIPYVLKAFACIVVWGALQYRLLAKQT